MIGIKLTLSEQSIVPDQCLIFYFCNLLCCVALCKYYLAADALQVYYLLR